MLDLIGSIVLMTTFGVNVSAVTGVLAKTLAQRLSMVAIAGAWVGLAIGLGALGEFAFSPDHPVPLVGVLFAVPLLVAGVLALTSPRIRQSLLGIPMHLLIGVNVMRVLGVLFLFLAAAGRLSGPFPISAGLGDIITGVLAIPLALGAARSEKTSFDALRVWNVFGALDLIVAVSLGVTSASGSPLQLIHAGVGSEAMQYLPYCLVPTVLVPFYLITHAIIAARLAESKRVPALSRA